MKSVQWIETFTGKRFHYLAPTLEEIDIRDIAHHLALLCRFTGAVDQFYSVGQHSILVAENLPLKLKLAGLLHDAVEAYTNDISTPVKVSHKLDATEQMITTVIEQKFGLDISQGGRGIIRHWDRVLLCTEARDLMPRTTWWHDLGKLPLEDKIVPWEPRDVEATFLGDFERYGGRR